DKDMIPILLNKVLNSQLADLEDVADFLTKYLAVANKTLAKDISDISILSLDKKSLFKLHLDASSRRYWHGMIII
ncbi:hypothetical protein DFQ30_009263, partial [Apophysomyces sp. BC1015]